MDKSIVVIFVCLFVVFVALIIRLYQKFVYDNAEMEERLTRALKGKS